MGAVFRWVKYIYEWCKNFGVTAGAGVGGGMPHGSFGGPIGNVFYVNGGGVPGVLPVGLDTNPGTRARPFETIAHALEQCANDHDDYIVCWNTYNQDTFPIHITLDSVHIIGVAAPNGGWPMLDATAGDTAVFSMEAENIEIAGFNLQGGAAHGAIEFTSGSNMCWIHHCTFGHYWTAAGQDGICSPLGGGSVWGIIVEHCWFYGSSGPCGKLARYGIFNADVSWGGWTIRNNYFLGVPTGAIILGATGAAHEIVIDHNCIGCGTDATGNAITLGNQSDGCIVQSNEAAHGSDTLMTTAPYSDTLGGDENHWMSNQSHSHFVLPDEIAA